MWISCCCEGTASNDSAFLIMFCGLLCFLSGQGGCQMEVYLAHLAHKNL